MLVPIAWKNRSVIPWHTSHAFHHHTNPVSGLLHLMGLHNLIEVDLLAFIFTWSWAPLVITLIHKSPGLPFLWTFSGVTEPCIPYLQHPGCLSPAAQWINHSIINLFYSLCACCCWALSCVPTQGVPFQESVLQSVHVIAQFGLYSGLSCCGLSPRSPVMVEHQTSLTGECFQIPLPTTKLSQLDKDHSNRIMVPLDQLTLGLVACHLFQLVQWSLNSCVEKHLVVALFFLLR